MMENRKIKVLVFDPDVSGHHLEYIQHIYGGFVRNHVPSVFVVRKEFQERMAFGKFPRSTQIEFRYLSSDEIDKIINPSILLGNYKRVKVLLKYTKEINPEYVFLITIIPYFPLVFIIRAKVIGIIYNLHTRNEKPVRFNPFYFVYWIFSKIKMIHTVFILNDPATSRMLCKHFNTTKFKFLPDPFPDISIDQIKDLKGRLKIPSTNFVFSHIGSMSINKGTMDILSAIRKLDKDIIKCTTFIFAGIIYDSISEPFEKELKVCMEEKGADIHVFNQFCTYDFLASVVKTSNYLLIPYKYVGQSSGMINYSMRFAIPLIGPADGLLGHLINAYHLGFTLKEINPQILAELITDIATKRVNYLIKHDKGKTGSVTEFSEEILKTIG